MMYDRGNPHSGSRVVGPGLMAGGMSYPAHAIPLAAPRPGYPAPVANLKLSSPSPPGLPSGQSSEPPQMGQVPHALRVARSQADVGTSRMPPPIYQTAAPKPSVPSAPHPLQPPITPIMPVFARPSRSQAPPDVKFSDPIIRGNSEDNLLPKRGERGDDFWRRFSMVAKEEKKPSSWLAKTQNGTTRLSRWVWMIGMILLICAGLGIGLWYYISHNNTTHQLPTAVGGSANETASPSSPTAEGHTSSSSPHVTPTFTLARRDTVPDPTPTGSALIRVPPEDAVKANVSGHNRRHWVHNF